LFQRLTHRTISALRVGEDIRCWYPNLPQTTNSHAQFHINHALKTFGEHESTKSFLFYITFTFITLTQQDRSNNCHDGTSFLPQSDQAGYTEKPSYNFFKHPLHSLMTPSSKLQPQNLHTLHPIICIKLHKNLDNSNLTLKNLHNDCWSRISKSFLYTI